MWFVWFFADLGLLDLCCGFVFVLWSWVGFGSCRGVVRFVFVVVVLPL